MNARDERREVRAIVQRWLDGTETSYPGYRALRELAVLLQLERVEPAPEPAPKRKRGRR